MEPRVARGFLFLAHDRVQTFFAHVLAIEKATDNLVIAFRVPPIASAVGELMRISDDHSAHASLA